MSRRLLSCAWKANCICRQNKAGRVVGAVLARAEGRWFGLSNTFINYDESPLQFTSNQRLLTVTQHWSPLAKWFSWPVASHTAKELATWWSGGCRDCCASGTQLDQSYLKQCGELSGQQAHRYMGSKAFKGQLERGSLKLKTFRGCEPWSEKVFFWPCFLIKSELQQTPAV